MAEKSDIQAEGRRIWPDAKRLEITEDAGVTVTAFDHDDRIIDSVSADSLHALKKRLEDLQPDGGQAP